jgi:hypothetical protein
MSRRDIIKNKEKLMALRKREVKKEVTDFVWMYSEERPVFLVPVDGSLQWVDSEGFHVGDAGLNAGSIKQSLSTTEELASIYKEFTQVGETESVKAIQGLAQEIQEYPVGSIIYYSYEEGQPILEDELENEEIETAVEVETAMQHVETPEAVVEEAKPTPQSTTNDYSKVSRQTLLHHLRKHKIKVRRGVEENTLIDIIHHADNAEWDLIKAHSSVESLNGEKTAPVDEPTTAEATQLVREVAKQMVEQTETTPSISADVTPPVEEETPKEVNFLSVEELMDKAKGYNWKFSMEEIEQSFSGQDLKIITSIYGSRDNEEIAFRLERTFDLTPTQINRLLDGFMYGSTEYPPLVELLMDSDIVS